MYEKNTKNELFSGVATALATPFISGEIDLHRFRNVCKWQCDSNIDAICVAGTTGEAATLSKEERIKMIAAAKEICGDEVQLIAGCGSSDTAVAVKYVKDAVECGATALLVITPYCNKGTESGILEHYRRVCDAACGVPIILYNVPSRTGVDIKLDMYKKLAKINNVCAVKEAAPNMSRITRLCAETDLCVYSGNDDMILPVMSVGGRGVISVLSNIVPSSVSELTKLALDGNCEKARMISQKYSYLTELLFEETNPAPLKYAMSLVGLCSDEMRLPMGEINDGLKEKLKAEMKRLAII